MLAAAIYAFGWTFAARLFSRFGVTPEEVGYSFSFLLIRVVFLVAAFFGVVALVVWILNRLELSIGARRVSLSLARISTEARWLASFIVAVPLILIALYVTVSKAQDDAQQSIEDCGDFQSTEVCEPDPWFTRVFAAGGPL